MHGLPPHLETTWTTVPAEEKTTAKARRAENNNSTENFYQSSVDHSQPQNLPSHHTHTRSLPSASSSFFSPWPKPPPLSLPDVGDPHASAGSGSLTPSWAVNKAAYGVAHAYNDARDVPPVHPYSVPDSPESASSSPSMGVRWAEWGMVQERGGNFTDLRDPFASAAPRTGAHVRIVSVLGRGGYRIVGSGMEVVRCRMKGKEKEKARRGVDGHLCVAGAEAGVDRDVDVDTNGYRGASARGGAGRRSGASSSPSSVYSGVSILSSSRGCPVSVSVSVSTSVSTSTSTMNLGLNSSRSIMASGLSLASFTTSTSSNSKPTPIPNPNPMSPIRTPTPIPMSAWSRNEYGNEHCDGDGWNDAGTYDCFWDEWRDEDGDVVPLRIRSLLSKERSPLSGLDVIPSSQVSETREEMGCGHGTERHHTPQPSNDAFNSNWPKF
ncbi:hypothetical protein BDZ94DRAFT_1236951 [Collybia nuda]|uniref:Uncharacterized protein n=1 Tax=Collybia nuda TaxID=64659 RepID=A0A9P6CDW3_9AGAR|nr:hypothetical protein BDZ94DRAFT_1236951 [Collybia nuda]